MKKEKIFYWIGNIVFIFLFVLVTFFGMGPVLIADGSFQERMFTLLVVIIIYVLLILAFRYWIKRNR